MSSDEDSMPVESKLLDAVHRNDAVAVKKLLSNPDTVNKITRTNGFSTLLQTAANKPKHDVLNELLYASIQHSTDKAFISQVLADYVHNCTSVQQQQQSNGHHTAHKLSLHAHTGTGEQLRNSLQHLSLKERVELVINSVKQGNIVIVVDSAHRENEGDLIIAAQHATPEKIAFIVNHTSGLICVGITASRCAELSLPPMVEHNTESHQTAFTVSIDYNKGDVTTGISASDRAATIRALAADDTKPSDFNRPGHIFPLKARAGGVLVRPGHTEASLDLPRLAGLKPAGAMCEIVKQDGSMLRPADLYNFAVQYSLHILHIEDLIEYRKQYDNDTQSGQ